MSVNRKFDFPISALIRSARLLHGALLDPVVGTPVDARLSRKSPNTKGVDASFSKELEEQIRLVEKGGVNQSSAIGSVGQMTGELGEAFTELERLMSGARRSATLSFSGNDPRLHSEFQVGIHDPKDFASEIDRARKIHAACIAHADELSLQGWIIEDTAALAETINLLDGGDAEHEAAKDTKKGFTQGRTTAANTLYKMCLSIQNAARLAYPSTRIAKDPSILVARNRYLLEEFPPRGGASAGDPAPAPAVTPV